MRASGARQSGDPGLWWARHEVRVSVYWKYIRLKRCRLVCCEGVNVSQRGRLVCCAEANPFFFDRISLSVHKDDKRHQKQRPHLCLHHH